MLLLPPTSRFLPTFDCSIFLWIRAGEKVPLNKKSMACSLTYRASDRTLTQEEANAAHGRLKSQLVERLGVTLRE